MAMTPSIRANIGDGIGVQVDTRMDIGPEGTTFTTQTPSPAIGSVPPDPERITAFCLAVFHGQEEGVRAFLDEKGDPDTFYGNYGTVLLVAVKQGHDGAVELLLERGAHPNVRDQYGETPLTMAAAKGYRYMISLLLGKGAHINVADSNGMTPLIWATEKSDRETVSLLLRSEGGDGKIEVDKRDNEGGTALSMAAMQGDMEIVKALLDAGADVNAEDNDGSTPLMVAAIEGHEELVELLLARGADVNQTNREGITALMFVSLLGNKKVLQILLEARADVSVTTEKGVNALMLATAKGDEDTVGKFIERGANPEVCTVEGKGALEMAVEHGHVAVVRSLLVSPLATDPAEGTQERGVYAKLREVFLVLQESLTLLVKSLFWGPRLFFITLAFLPKYFWTRLFPNGETREEGKGEEINEGERGGGPTV